MTRAPYISEPKSPAPCSNNGVASRMRSNTAQLGVRWIADNDGPADDDPVEALAGYISVGLLADLVGVPAREVARHVWMYRHRVQMYRGAPE